MGILEAVRDGIEVFDLGHPLHDKLAHSPNHPGFRMALIKRHGDDIRGGGLTAANEIMVMGGHTGTHIDALSHIAVGGRLYGGVDASEAVSGGRFHVHGIDKVAPMFCRGVLLDIAGAQGVLRLPCDYGIGADDLTGAAKGLDIGKGDVVLVRTGWSQLIDNPGLFIGRDTGVPGVTAEGAGWLAQLGIAATGSDTLAYEFLEAGVGLHQLPVHGLLLKERGVHVIEMLQLEALATAGIKEFVFVLAPLPIVGATASPVRPIAVVDRHA